MQPTDATQTPAPTDVKAKAVDPDLLRQIVEEMSDKWFMESSEPTDEDARACGFPSVKSLRMAPRIYQVTKRLLYSTFGRLQILRYYPSDQANGIKARCECICDCGTVKDFDVWSVTQGFTTSCGCYLREIIGQARRTHGLSHTPEYHAWRNMISRCNDPWHASFHDYGGRGITVCERWLGDDGFKNFYADVGVRTTPLHSLDRSDNDGNYEPGNVKWATRDEQNRNQRRSVVVEWAGSRTTVPRLAKELGISARFLYGRLRRGIPLLEAVTMPKFSKRITL